MTVEVISIWYNGELLTPFFLRNYSRADIIHIIYDNDATDSTKEVISRFQNAEIIPFQFSNKFND